MTTLEFSKPTSRTFVQELIEREYRTERLAQQSANLTPDLATGTGRYTVPDIVSLFKTGKDKEGNYLCAATHGVPPVA